MLINKDGKWVDLGKAIVKGKGDFTKHRRIILGMENQILEKTADMTSNQAKHYFRAIRRNYTKTEELRKKGYKLADKLELPKIKKIIKKKRNTIKRTLELLKIR